MENKQIHAGNEQYDENFYTHMKTDSYRYGSGLVQILSLAAKYVRPRSVLDVGCAIGTWLEFWQKNFGADIFGIDGDYVDRSHLLIEEKFFQAANLEERITFDKRFDLVETLEVAEHLTPARADSFVEDLTKLSDVILFSAAIPAQGGTNHVNEQWQSYWAEKFLKFGYVAVDCIRPAIWEDNRIDARRKQNPFIYVKSSELYRYPELQEFYLKHRDATIFNMVHPAHYVMKLAEFRNFYQRVQDYLAKNNVQGGVISFNCRRALNCFPRRTARRDFFFEYLNTLPKNFPKRRRTVIICAAKKFLGGF